MTQRVRFKQRGVELPNDPVVGLIARKSGIERRYSAGLVVAKQQSLVGLLARRAALRQSQYRKQGSNTAEAKGLCDV